MDDTNNTLNKWLADIYDDCAARSGLRAKALNLDMDTYAISTQEYRTIHLFAKSAMNAIVNRCAMVQYIGQTPIDAINFIKQYDTDLDSDDALGRDDFTQDTKMQQKDIQSIIFDVDGVEREDNRYTTIQQYIRDSILEFVLMEWYKLMGMYKDAAVHRESFNTYVSGINTSASLNSKSITRTPRYF